MTDKKTDDIDVAELLRFLWHKRTLLLRITSIFLGFGLLIAVTAKVEYESRCKLMPESQDSLEPDLGSLGGLGGLAGLAGINLNLGSSGFLTPELYPEFVKSIPFIDTLINSPVYFEKQDTVVSSFEYFKNIERRTLSEFVLDYTLGLPGKIKSIFTTKSEGTRLRSDDELIRLTQEDWEIYRDYSARLDVSVDPQTGIILVSTEMPDALASAKIATTLVDKLTEKIIAYKIEKATQNLEFVQERFNEAKTEYEIKQEQLARYTDRNRNIASSLNKTEYERLQNEMDIAFEVYKGLATQLEQSKIKVKEETPVFTILEPVRVPTEKSSPKRMLIIVSFAILGLIFSSIFIIVKHN